MNTTNAKIKSPLWRRKLDNTINHRSMKPEIIHNTMIDFSKRMIICNRCHNVGQLSNKTYSPEVNAEIIIFKEAHGDCSIH